MTVLRTIERRIEGLFERGFRRAFRSSLQPVELARKLGREMEESKTVSVSRVYVANEFTVFLSPSDRESFASFESTLCEELSTYLAAQARAGGYAMVADAAVALETDEDLRQGEFGVASRMAEEPQGVPSASRDGIPAPKRTSGGDFRPAGAPASAPRPAVGPASIAAAVPRRAAPPPPQNPGLRGVSGTQVMSAGEARHHGMRGETLTIVTATARERVSKRVTTIGRSRDCDIVVADPNASRLHAEVRHSGEDYLIVDMGSTNGLEVNGRAAKRQALANGDTIQIGTTELRIEIA